MTGKNREELVEQYEDAAFSLLMSEYAEQEGARLLQEFEAAKPEVPATLDVRCRKLIRQVYEKERRRIRLNRALRTLCRTVTVLFVALGLCATLVFSVEAVRVPVINFLIEHKDGFMVISGDHDDDRKPIGSDHFDRRDPLNGLIPADYALERFVDLNNGSTAIYLNGTKDKISLTTTISSASLTVDTENTEYRKELPFYGYKAVFTKADTISLIWLSPDGEMMYCLVADALSDIKMMSVARSLLQRMYPDIIENNTTTQLSFSDGSQLDPYMPEGYVLFRASVQSNESQTIIYQNAEDSTILFSVHSDAGMTNIDTENATVEEINLAGYSGIFVKKGNHQKLIWHDEERRLFYMVSASDLDPVTLWCLAEQLAQCDWTE